jgi:uncharacterized protein YdaU (DUF1376 family)
MPKDPTLPGFVFYVDDFSSDEKVEAMTTEEVGAYILLLCKAWRSSPPATIPDDDSVLCRWTRLGPERWAECKQRVLAAFTPCADSRLLQKRMRQEYDRITALKKKRVTAALAGATARYSQEKPAIRIPTAEQSQSNRMPYIGLGSNLDSSPRDRGSGKGGAGFPASETEAVEWAMITGIERVFIVDSWNKALGRGGCDHRDVPIRNWVGHLKTEWKYEQERRAKQLKTTEIQKTISSNRV